MDKFFKLKENGHERFNGVFGWANDILRDVIHHFCQSEHS